MSKGIKGHIRLAMRFSKPLLETINIIIYRSFPETLSIEHSRNVNLDHEHRGNFRSNEK